MVGREAILKIHIKNINKGPDVKLRTIARGTPGFSGADLANLVNESALLAASNADSLHKFARSAPEKPGVPRAIILNFTSGPILIFLI